MNARIVLALSLALFAAGAIAKDYPTFQQVDANGDGMLSLGELETIEEFNQEDEEFAESDLDKNGSLNAAEYQAWLDMQATKLAAKEAKAGGKAEAKN